MTQLLSELVGHDSDNDMSGGRCRSTYRGYGIEWYEGGDGKVLVVLGGHEYGWAADMLSAMAAIDAMITSND